MNYHKLSNKELAGAMRTQENAKKFIDMAKEFVTRYVNGDLAAEARQDGYEAGYNDGYQAGRELLDP